MKRIPLLGTVILLVLATHTQLFSHDGEKLFKGNCGICHSIGKGKLVGPDLKGVNERYEEAWLLSWIKSSQALIKSGDAKAVQIFNENNKMVMPDQLLADDEIKALLSFVKEKEKQPEVIAQNPPANIQGHQANKHPGFRSLISVLGFSGYMMAFLIGLLLIVAWVMGMSIKKLSVENREKLKQ